LALGFAVEEGYVAEGDEKTVVDVVEALVEVEVELEEDAVALTGRWVRLHARSQLRDARPRSSADEVR
jgi:formate dehydrogenase assembly factor FdhD